MTKLESHQHRLSSIQKEIPAKQIWLIATPTLITYLSGFEFLVPNEREAYLVLTAQFAYILCGGFTTHSVLQFLKELQIKPISHPHKVLEHLREIIKESKADHLMVDIDGLSASELIGVGPLFKPNVVSSSPTISLLNIPSVPTRKIHQMRLLKDAYEQKCLTEAGALIRKVMNTVINQLKVGVTEVEIKALLDYELLKAGSKPAFPTIVAFGENAVEPHYQPATTTLEHNMPVLIDAGAVVDGYCSDMTRTVWFGDSPSEAFLKVESVVKEGYGAAVRRLQDHQQNKQPDAASLTAASLDQSARDSISHQNMGQYFIHTLGHGVGLEIHESPSISGGNNASLLPGMAITIEPGVYLPTEVLPNQPDKIGYRYENTCLITQDGVVELT